MATFKTPGIHIEEIPSFPPSVAAVKTAIPAFIGYTEKAQQLVTGDLNLKPFKINSYAAYEQYFGFPQSENSIEVTIDTSQANPGIEASIRNTSLYLMSYALKLFFNNGGGSCYIVSVGDYPVNNSINDADLKKGLDELEKIDEITLIIFPDAINLGNPDLYYNLYKNAILQCAMLMDRFIIMDVWKSVNADDIKTLREFDFGPTTNLSYAAAYYPLLISNLKRYYKDDDVSVIGVNDVTLSGTLAELLTKNNNYYQQAKQSISDIPVVMPASPAVAGVYIQVDNSRGVWKPPANVSINSVIEPQIKITDTEQKQLNVDPVTGKSINAIRSFPGHGNAIVWGARTLAGNDNEWRYIPVRRLFMMVEESCKKATEFCMFEPNNATTWIKIQSMIENFLTTLWRQGALAGAKPEHAFFVKAGLGTTMTAVDILQGRLIVEIGMAAIRPAEFIVLRFAHKVQES